MVYAQLLQAKIEEYPDLDICISNTAIGEVDESGSSGSSPPRERANVDSNASADALPSSNR